MAVDTHTSIELRQAVASTNLLASIIGDWAKGHGFDEDWEMAEWLENFAGSREYGGMFSTEAPEVVEKLKQAADIIRRNVVSAKLMLIVTEVAECMESLRDTGVDNITTEGNFGEELADIQIRVKNLANLLGINLGQIEVDKIKTNANRPHKHGRKM